MFVQNFKFLGAVVPEKSLTKKILEKKKNGQIKRIISMRMLSLSNTVQQIIANVVANFYILEAVVQEKSLTEKSYTKKHTHRQTNITTEKTKTIFPQFTSYAGGIISLRSTYPNRISENHKVDRRIGKIRNVQSDRHGLKIKGCIFGN